jgi:hypothetical protein
MLHTHTNIYTYIAKPPKMAARQVGCKRTQINLIYVCAGPVLRPLSVAAKIKTKIPYVTALPEFFLTTNYFIPCVILVNIF